jgi:hypothetical protein
MGFPTRVSFYYNDKESKVMHPFILTKSSAGIVGAVLVFGGLSFSAPLPAAVQSKSTQGLPSVRTATTDLNGDGKQEKIDIFYTKDSPRQLVLSVNGTKLTEKDKGYDEEDSPSFRIVKLDSAKKAQQIAVELAGPSSLGETLFYRWDGKAIRRIGSVPNAEKITGNGAVYGSVYMDFWTCSQKYVFNPKTQTLTFVRQPMYSVGESATVKQSFPVLREHTTGSGTVANVAPGSKIQLVMFWSPASQPEDSTKANSWFLIKTATGLSGWTRLDTFEKKVDGLIHGG